MSDQREQKGSARDALLVAVGTARLAGWIGMLAGVGVLIYTFVGPEKPNYWVFFAMGVLLLGFGLTWSLLARIGGALGALAGR